MNIDLIKEKIYATVMSHRLSGEGEYTRWLWQDKNGNRKLGINEYGCADAANILYTIGEFPADEKTRESFVRTLRGLQNPETGLFTEETHHFIHTTAHCTAALELFEAKPAYPFKALEKYATAEGVKGLLEELDWKGSPWNMSHRGAGIYAALVLGGRVDLEWQDAYFNWLWENSDPETGFWRAGCVKSGKAPVSHSLAGTFHYLFNHEYAKRPLRYPEKVIDSCIELYENNELQQTFGRQITFLEIDWVYCITRSMRQTPHRFEDCKRVLREFAQGYIGYLEALDEKTNEGFNDLHSLFGCTSCLAELQQALPGEIKSTKPFKLVLDRRPFI